MTGPTPKLQRPAPGAPFDKRLTPAKWQRVRRDADRPFNPAEDVDFFDAVEDFVNAVAPGGAVVAGQLKTVSESVKTVSDGVVTMQSALSGTLADLSTRTQADGPQFADGSRWLWQATGTPDGGTVLAAADGGVWARELVGGAITPQMFGAVADGVHDDTAAIQAAITAAAKQQRVLDFGAWNYRVSKLAVRDAVGLRWRAAGATITGDDRTRDASPDAGDPNDYSSVINLLYCKDILLSGNMTVRMAGTWAPVKNSSPGRVKSVACIKLGWCQDFEISDWAAQYSTCFGYLIESSKRGRLIRPRVFSTLADGIHIANDSQDIVVDSPHTRLTGDDGVATICADATPGRQTARVLILNPDIAQSYARGVGIGGAADITVRGGTIRDTSSAGIIAFRDTYVGTPLTLRVLLDGVRIYGAGTWGVAIGSGAGVSLGDGTYGTGNIEDSTIQNCQVFDARTAPYEVTGTRSRVVNCYGTGGGAASLVGVPDRGEIDLTLENGQGLLLDRCGNFRANIISRNHAGTGLSLNRCSQGNLMLKISNNGTAGLRYTGCADLLINGQFAGNAQVTADAHVVGTSDAGVNTNVQMVGVLFAKGSGQANMPVYLAAGSTNCNLVSCGLKGSAADEAPQLNNSGQNISPIAA